MSMTKTVVLLSFVDICLENTNEINRNLCIIATKTVPFWVFFSRIYVVCQSQYFDIKVIEENH